MYQILLWEFVLQSIALQASMQISLSNLKVWVGKFYCTSKNIVHFYLATCYTKMDKTSWPLSTILRYRYSFPNVTFCCLVTRCPIYPVQTHETFRVTQSTFFWTNHLGHLLTTFTKSMYYYVIIHFLDLSVQILNCSVIYPFLLYVLYILKYVWIWSIRRGEILDQLYTVCPRSLDQYPLP